MCTVVKRVYLESTPEFYRERKSLNQESLEKASTVQFLAANLTRIEPSYLLK
jgi:hypothetical protein